MRHRLFSYAIILGLFPAAALTAGTAAAGPSLLMDVTTGRVLAHEDAFKRWYPASLTKLMTAYVTFRAIEAGEITLLSPVEISARASREPPSKMGYAPGSVLSVDNAIKILMVKSANDVATALGETVGGSERAFAERMNREAARLGMTGSNFVNAHGLHSDEQYSTARDLALLGRAIIEDFPEHAGFFSIEAIGAGNTVMANHNNLIGRFEGADGMKTGYTCPSGFNLIATATREDRRLLAVVIGATSVEERAAQAAGLLADGFARSDFAAPRLAGLVPYGEKNEEAINLRDAICTAEWQAELAERRKAAAEAGTPVSPHLVEMERPPSVVAVALGGATGPRSTQPRYADVPIPTPRPDYEPEIAVAAGEEPDAENAAAQPAAEGEDGGTLPTPASGVPVPTLRATLGQ